MGSVCTFLIYIGSIQICTYGSINILVYTGSILLIYMGSVQIRMNLYESKLGIKKIKRWEIPPVYWLVIYKLLMFGYLCVGILGFAFAL